MTITHNPDCEDTDLCVLYSNTAPIDMYPVDTFIVYPVLSNTYDNRVRTVHSIQVTAKHFISHVVMHFDI